MRGPRAGTGFAVTLGCCVADLLDTDDWRPGASLETLRARAAMLAALRGFFLDHGILEVDTPMLSRAAATDPALESFATDYRGPGCAGGERRYLHTSPEFPMKRLLAAGAGALFQVCHVFRNGEAGRLHNPEFTMVEWYRPGFDHHQLMDEVEALVRRLFAPYRPLPAADRVSYAEVFARHVGVDPHTAGAGILRQAVRGHGIEPPTGLGDERSAWLDLLLTHVVEPQLGIAGPCFVYDYPAQQAALAQVRPGLPPVAERFELYLQGIELANGFHELRDPAEQRARFAADRERRQGEGLSRAPEDARLLHALEAGLPPCAGVALGFDRLLMLALGKRSVAEVMPFAWPLS